MTAARISRRKLTEALPKKLLDKHAIAKLLGLSTGEHWMLRVGVPVRPFRIQLIASPVQEPERLIFALAQISSAQAECPVAS